MKDAGEEAGLYLIIGHSHFGLSFMEFPEGCVAVTTDISYSTELRIEMCRKIHSFADVLA